MTDKNKTSAGDRIIRNDESMEERRFQMKITAAPEQIRPYVGAYRTYPVSAEMMSDMRTPIEVLRALQKVSGHVYMLESVSGHEKWGRYTFLGYDPKLEINCFDGRMKIGALTIQTDDPGEYIRQVLAEHSSPKIDHLPSFTGGLVGYFSYDYLKYAEPTLNLDAGDSEGFRDVDLMLFDKVICFDNYRQKLILIVNMELPYDESKMASVNGAKGSEGDASGCCSRAGSTLQQGNAVMDAETERQLQTSYNKAVMELQNMEALIRKGEMSEIVPGRMTSRVRPLFSEDQFCEMVEKAKKHIFEGDIFQVVLSNRLEADYEGSLLNTYRILRTVNPSPYMFYFAS